MNKDERQHGAIDLIRKEYEKRWDSGFMGTTQFGPRPLNQAIEFILLNAMKSNDFRIEDVATLGDIASIPVRMDDGSMWKAEQMLKLHIGQQAIGEITYMARVSKLWVSGDIGQSEYSDDISKFASGPQLESLSDLLWDEVVVKKHYSRPLADFFKARKYKDGFYQNPDYPFTPPMAYEPSAIITKVFSSKHGPIITRIAKNELTSAANVSVYDWHGKVESADGATAAYCSGILFSCPSGRLGYSSMIHASDEISDSYVRIVEKAAKQLGEGDSTVMFIQAFEHLDDVSSEVAIDCLRTTVQSVIKHLGDKPTVHIDASPRQYMQLGYTSQSETPIHREIANAATHNIQIASEALLGVCEYRFHGSGVLVEDE